MRNKAFGRLIALGLVFVLLALLFSALGFSSPRIDVYFSPEGGAERAIVQKIDEAKKTVDVAMYAFTSRELAWALVKAQQRGVKIRVLLDDKFSSSCKYSKERFLYRRHIALRVYRNPERGIMHHKFAIIDHQILLCGSYNWTASAEKWNCEDLLIITQFPKLIKKFQREFDRLWRKGVVPEKALAPEAVISATDLRRLRKYTGKFIVVEGEVKEVAYSKRSDTYFLKFDVIRPCFTAVIFSSVAGEFRAQKKDPHKYQGKRVRISGWLIEHPKYGLEIILDNPSQIEEIID